MSFTITKNKITLTKGDTFIIPIDFHQQIEGAKITINLYKKESSVPFLTKVISNHTEPQVGKSLLLIEKEELDLIPDTYKIDMSITFLNGIKYTFFPPSPEIKAEFEIIPTT